MIWDDDIKNIILKILGYILGALGIYGIIVSDMILDIEFSLGINNMPRISMLKLAALFFISLVFIISGYKLVKKVED